MESASSDTPDQQYCAGSPAIRGDPALIGWEASASFARYALRSVCRPRTLALVPTSAALSFHDSGSRGGSPGDLSESVRRLRNLSPSRPRGVGRSILRTGQPTAAVCRPCGLRFRSIRLRRPSAFATGGLQDDSGSCFQRKKTTLSSRCFPSVTNGQGSFPVRWRGLPPRTNMAPASPSSMLLGAPA